MRSGCTSSAPAETAPPLDQREGAVGMRVDVKRVLKNYGILFAFILVCAILAWLSPVFLRWNNVLNVIRQSSIYGIMAVGMTFVILTGGRITPFVTTLGMMSIGRSLTLIYCQGYPISGFNPQFRYLGGGDLLGIPFPIVVFLVTVILAAVILSETRLGRYTYAIGGNEETVRLSGVRTNFYKTMVYVFAGVTSAVSAVILTSRLNSAEPVAGMGYELDVIAAVVIGGTSLNGGRGSVWGTLVGALLIAVINNGMVLLGISPYFQQLVKGLIILGAVLLDRLRDEPA